LPPSGWAAGPWSCRAASHRRELPGEELRQHKESILEILARRELPPDPRPQVASPGDKAEFFKGNWREAWPRDFTVYKGGKA
jgi:hypothetical protein